MEKFDPSLDHLFDSQSMYEDQWNCNQLVHSPSQAQESDVKSVFGFQTRSENAIQSYLEGQNNSLLSPNPTFVSLLSFNNPNPIFFKQVFRQMQAKNQRKNTNFTKFILVKFTKQMKRLHLNLNISNEHWEYISKTIKKIESKGKDNITMEGLSLMFSKPSEDSSQRYITENRKLLSRWLSSRQFLFDLLSSKAGKDYNKKQKLLTAKIFKIRSRSKYLIRRTQSK